MNVFVSGGAGFIAVHLIERLLESGATVVVADNFCRGSADNIAAFRGHPAFQFVRADLSIRSDCAAAFAAAKALGPIDEVWHLAANSDIPAGVADPDIDYRDTFLTTYEILRQMREQGVGRFFFASSSAIYGDHGTKILQEDSGPLSPISNYGAMKLASEAITTAAVESFLAQALLFRFPNVVGVPATHGVLRDFILALKRHPGVLTVLGDGTQQKAYLHVSDLLAAMVRARERAPPRGVHAYNIGPIDDGVRVSWIAEQVTARVSPAARIVFGTGNKGWVGDVPRFSYSTAKIQALGWSPKASSEEAVRRAIGEIAKQEGV